MSGRLSRHFTEMPPIMMVVTPNTGKIPINKPMVELAANAFGVVPCCRKLLKLSKNAGRRNGEKIRKLGNRTSIGHCY